MSRFAVTRMLAAVSLTLFCFATTAFGAAYLKIDGIDGESNDAALPCSIEITGHSFDVMSPPIFRRGGGGTGKVSMSDLSFTKRIDKSSPQLMLACAKGKHFPSADLHLRTSGDTPRTYLKIKMTDILVSSYAQTGDDSGDDLPMESISLNFTKIEFTFVFPGTTGAPDENVMFTWDLKTNTGR